MRVPASISACRIRRIEIDLVASGRWKGVLVLKLPANESYFCKCCKKVQYKKKFAFHEVNKE
jgi:hypothetical protein